ncbi:hypothetical protein BCR34DRAFT_348303 [Clohesyomyces aquaticus]|uniref:Cora-like Mg2+ transporter protein-domain-containing protein n=1 Tax=Clohesyomyces aquaticus TaxID=1231657 RepID=A0A1Y1ZJL5_9PLEO|nr:hypothetical protein BCR34DRAFT_348303 [Clohesyomyces aquaticus]
MASPHRDNWNIPSGSYRQLFESLSKSDPRLKLRDKKAVRQRTPWPPESVRIKHLQLQTGKNYTTVGKWADVADFSVYLQAGRAIDESQRNVFLIEGLGPELIETLGSHFNIHPSFFVDHERVEVFSARPSNLFDSGRLPSGFRWKVVTGGVTLNYFEVVDTNTDLPNFSLSCADSGRHVGATRFRGQLSSVVIVRRKCSIFLVEYSAGGSAYIVLTDPPLSWLRTFTYISDTSATKQVHDVQVFPRPYQGGYIDFVPQDVQLAVRNGPLRSSMFSDLKHYLTLYNASLPQPGGAESPMLFAKKIVASHYLSLSSFMTSALSHQQWDFSRRDDMSHFDISAVEQSWSDIQSWERRLNEYVSDIEDIMLKLGIPFQEPDTSHMSMLSWSESVVDFQFLRYQFHTLLHRAEQINGATLGLASMAGNRQGHQEQQRSLRESQRMRALTLVGLVFIPLAYTATLFSMNEKYMPGAGHFWIYFSVSVPLIIAVILGYLILDWAYYSKESSHGGSCLSRRSFAGFYGGKKANTE